MPLVHPKAWLQTFKGGSVSGLKACCNEAQVEVLLASLRNLEVLCCRGCRALPAAAVSSLRERYPGVHIHQSMWVRDGRSMT